MKLFTLGSAVLLILVLHESASAQCEAPELVKGADTYDQVVCEAYAAARTGDDKKALDLFLAASEQPVLESPNIRLFGRIAATYAKLGRFQEADLYLKYDNLSVLWMIGVVRCQEASGSTTTDESLFKDGIAILSSEAKHMAVVLCGPVFDDFSYFQDRDAESFVPAAKAILQYATLRREIDMMRHRKPRDRP